MKREAIVSLLLVGLFLVSVFPMRTFSGTVDTDGISEFLRAQSSADQWHSMATTSGSVGYWHARFFTLGNIVIFSYKDGLNVSIYNSTGTLLITQSLNKGNHYLYPAGTLGVYSTIGNQEYSVLVGDPVTFYVMGYFAANDSYYGVANEFYTYVASDQDVITFAYDTGTTNVNVEYWTGSAWSALSTFSLTGPGDHYLNSNWHSKWLHFTSNQSISVECYSDRCFSVPADSGLWAGTHFYLFAGWYFDGDNIHIHSYKNSTTITVKYIGGSTIWTGTLNDGKWKNIDRSLIGTSKYVEVTSNDTVTVSDEPSATSDYYGLLAVPDQSGTGVGTRFYTYARESPPSGVGDIWVFPYEKNTNVTIKDMTAGGATVWTGALNLNEYHQFTPSAGTGGHLFGIFSDDVVSVMEGSGPQAGAAFVPLVSPPRGRYATIPTNDGKHFKNDVFWDWIKGNFTKGNYKDMTFVFGECYGGGLVNSLPITDLPNTAVMSASAWNEPSYGAPPGPETPNDYDTFLQGVTDALRTNPTNTFDQIFSDSKSRDIANPDSPNFWGGSAKEHPQISPWSGNNMKLHDGVSNYAIMFAGDPNGLRHWNDLARMYNVMTTSLGYAASDITVLYGDGTGKMPNGTQSPVAVSASATLANLQNTIINVANKMNPNGTLLFWVSDHGDLDEGILDKTAVVNAYGTYQFQFNLDPEYIQAISLSTSSPYVEIAHQGVTSNNTVVINNVPVGSLDSLSNTTTIPFSTNMTFSPFDNTFTIISYQGTNFTISNITLTSGSVPTQQPVHDVAITNVMPSKTVVGQNFSANISVTVANQGSWTEAFNATLYAESQTTMNQTAINQTGLVGYWKFDEGSGTTAYDSSGNNNHGTISGPVWTDGRIGSALQFDGINDYLQVPDSAGLNITNDEISIAAWVKMLGDGTNNGVIVCKQALAGTGSASYSLDVYPSIHSPVGRHVEFAVNVEGSWTPFVSTSALNLSTWNRIVGTYDGSKVRIFINGVLDTEYALVGNIVPKNGPLYIGHEDAWSPGEYFNGTIDEVKIYNKALSAEEIWTEYAHAPFAIGTQTVTLESGASKSLTFTWNTTGFAYGNYTLNAYASPVLNETNTSDNNFTYGIVKVTIPGDINGNYVVNILDAILLSNAYNSHPGSLGWNANADINGDNVVNIFDAIILSNNYNPIRIPPFP